MNAKYEEATEVANSRELLQLWDDIIFGVAIQETRKQHKTLVKKPENVPNEDDTMLIHVDAGIVFLHPTNH